MSVAALARARATVRIARTTTARTRISTALTTEARLAGATAGAAAAAGGATVDVPTAAVTRRNTGDAGVAGVVADVRAALGVVHASDAERVTRNALATRTFLPRGTTTGCATHISVRTTRSA